MFYSKEGSFTPVDDIDLGSKKFQPKQGPIPVESKDGEGQISADHGVPVISQGTELVVSDSLFQLSIAGVLNHFGANEIIFDVTDGRMQNVKVYQSQHTMDKPLITPVTPSTDPKKGNGYGK